MNVRRKLRIALVVSAIALKAGRWRAVLVLLMQLMLVVSGLATAHFVRVVADASLARDLRGALLGAAALGFVTLMGIVGIWSGWNLRTEIDERARYMFEERMMQLVASVPLLEPHERPEFVDRLDVLRTNSSVLTGAIWSVYSNAAFVVQNVLTGVLLADVHPVLLLLPLFGLPSMWTGSKGEGIRQRMLDRQAAPLRVVRHLFDLSTTPSAGKELRVFRLSTPFLQRHDAEWRACNREHFRIALIGAVLRIAGWACFSVGYVSGIVLVVWLAVHGRATPGDVLLAIMLASRVQTTIAEGIGMARELRSRLATAERYLWLLDYAADASRGPSAPAPVPARLHDGIRFESVSFRYPGTDVDVLRDVELHLPAGSTAALVGDNGAGKTTIVKLLSGFYRPTSGRITVDGVDLSDLDVAEWRGRMSGGFQDFAKLEFIARESVGVGDVAVLDDAAAVEAAVDRAGAADAVEGLPWRLDTQLGRTWEGGVELSGGQWQKLALARAMMRPGPLVLLLDEPTASLDAPTEHALFERYAGAARTAALSNGAITVLVSHRFSTVRMADLIVVCDEGRIVEQGSHDGLVRNDGLYAELYALQARAYR